MTAYTWSDMKAAEPRLDALETMARMLAGHARRGRRPLCQACTGSDVIDPLLESIVGWGRGLVPESASMPRNDLPMIDFRTASIDLPARIEPTTEIERFLRTSRAWDMAQLVLLDILYRADPGTGCSTGAASDDELLALGPDPLYSEGERYWRAVPATP
jgi:hypothetical protein